MMLVGINSGEHYPLFSIVEMKDTQDDGYFEWEEVDLTTEEIARIRAADDEFWKCQSLMRGALKAAGHFGW